VAFKTAVAAATTVDQVITVARDYLHVWGEVLHRLPAQCRPVRIESADDVLRAANALTQFRRQRPNPGDPEGPELTVTADFFAAAAARIRQLEHDGLRHF
jgi:hypothetical protein